MEHMSTTFSGLSIRFAHMSATHKGKRPIITGPKGAARIGWTADRDNTNTKIQVLSKKADRV
jgi:hypothetical protein